MLRVVTTLVAGVAILAACNRVDSTQTSSDTTVNESPATPESFSAVRASSNPLPQVCPRRPGSTLVTAKGIGPAQLGTSLVDLRKQCVVRDSVLRADDGQPAVARAISVGGGSAPVLIFVDGAAETIRRVASDNPLFRTPMGIGVGSTVGELRQVHGRPCGGLGPTGIEVWVGSLPGVVFGTTAYPPKMPGGGTGLKSNANAVPDTAQITTVAVSTTAHPARGKTSAIAIASRKQRLTA